MAVPILKVEKPRIQPVGLAYNGAQRVRSALNPQCACWQSPSQAPLGPLYTVVPEQMPSHLEET